MTSLFRPLFPGSPVAKNLPANAGDIGDTGSVPDIGEIPWSRKWQTTPVFLLRKFHGQRSLAVYNPWRSQRVSHKAD